jgi:hypothetical protein
MVQSLHGRGTRRWGTVVGVCLVKIETIERMQHHDAGGRPGGVVVHIGKMCR